MLRALVLMFGCLLAGVGAALCLAGVKSPGLEALIFGAVLVCAVLFERWRYGRLEKTPTGEWQATGERFSDPQTGLNVEVFYNPHTGERRYSSPEAEHNRSP